jgi:hypothetical protein
LPAWLRTKSVSTDGNPAPVLLGHAEAVVVVSGEALQPPPDPIGKLPFFQIVERNLAQNGEELVELHTAPTAALDEEIADPIAWEQDIPRNVFCEIAGGYLAALADAERHELVLGNHALQGGQRNTEPGRRFPQGQERWCGLCVRLLCTGYGWISCRGTCLLDRRVRNDSQQVVETARGLAAYTDRHRPSRN